MFYGPSILIAFPFLALAPSQHKTDLESLVQMESYNCLANAFSAEISATESLSLLVLVSISPRPTHTSYKQVLGVFSMAKHPWETEMVPPLGAKACLVCSHV